MRYDHQLYLYLHNFRISGYPQFSVIYRKCALCKLKSRTQTVNFVHKKSGYTLVRDLCQSCSDQIRKVHAKLQAKEDIDVETP